MCPNLKELAQIYTYAAIDKIRRLMSDPKQPGAVQLAAAQTLLDRGWGKPAQALAVAVKINPLEHLSDEELNEQIDFLQKKWNVERLAVPLVPLPLPLADMHSAAEQSQDADSAGNFRE